MNTEAENLVERLENEVIQRVSYDEVDQRLSAANRIRAEAVNPALAEIENLVIGNLRQHYGLVPDASHSQPIEAGLNEDEYMMQQQLQQNLYPNSNSQQKQHHPTSSKEFTASEDRNNLNVEQNGEGRNHVWRQEEPAMYNHPAPEKEYGVSSGVIGPANRPDSHDNRADYESSSVRDGRGSKRESSRSAARAVSRSPSKRSHHGSSPSREHDLSENERREREYREHGRSPSRSPSKRSQHGSPLYERELENERKEREHREQVENLTKARENERILHKEGKDSKVHERHMRMRRINKARQMRLMKIELEDLRRKVDLRDAQLANAKHNHMVLARDYERQQALVAKSAMATLEQKESATRIEELQKKMERLERVNYKLRTKAQAREKLSHAVNGDRAFGSSSDKAEILNNHPRVRELERMNSELKKRLHVLETKADRYRQAAAAAQSNSMERRRGRGQSIRGNGAGSGRTRFPSVRGARSYVEGEDNSAQNNDRSNSNSNRNSRMQTELTKVKEQMRKMNAENRRMRTQLDNSSVERVRRLENLLAEKEQALRRQGDGQEPQFQHGYEPIGAHKMRNQLQQFREQIRAQEFAQQQQQMMNLQLQQQLQQVLQESSAYQTELARIQQFMMRQNQNGSRTKRRKRSGRRRPRKNKTRRVESEEEVEEEEEEEEGQSVPGDNDDMEDSDADNDDDGKDEGEEDNGDEDEENDDDDGNDDGDDDGDDDDEDDVEDDDDDDEEEDEDDQ